MSARDELRKYANLLADAWTPRKKTDDRVEWLYGLVRAEVLRDWAAKIRQVGTAKGWSTWAAAYMDPDVPFVDTGMPSTETIVAELRRLDRVAVLREAADLLRSLANRLTQRGAGVLWAAARLIQMADEAEKDTSGGSQPRAGESTPDFFQPLHLYRRTSHGQFIYFRVDHVATAPGSTMRTAFGWLTTERGSARWQPHNEDDFADWTDITEDGA